MGTADEKADENDGKSDSAWPRPEFFGSRLSLDNIRCSSQRSSQCQYLRTSEIPTQLLNLVLPDTDEEDDAVVEVEERSNDNSVDKASRRRSSVLSLAMSEEFGLELGRK